MPAAFGRPTKFSPQEVRALYKRVQVAFSTPEIRIWQAPKTLEYARLLIVIPRKVGSAVTRNKLRRRIKNLFYQLNFYQGPMDYIIRLYPGAHKLSFKDLQHILAQCTKEPHYAI